MAFISEGARAIFVENLRHAMESRSITQADIVATLGITASTVSDWANGKKYPRIDAMQRLADLLGVRVSDLSRAVDTTPVIPTYAIPFERQTRIPVLGAVRAGFGGLAAEEIEGYEWADVRDPDEHFFLRVTGDSMTPYIYAGEYALIRIQPDVESGEVAVVVINGDEGMIKKVIKTEGGVILQSFNPDYAPRMVVGAELAELRIIGKVTETTRKW